MNDRSPASSPTERVEAPHADLIALDAALNEAMNTGVLTSNPISQVYFRAGLLAARETMARFVEQGGDIATAASIRANWWPCLGNDPGAPRRFDFDEIAEEKSSGGWRSKPIGASVEALATALKFMEAAGSADVAPSNSYEPEGWMQVRIGDFLSIRQTTEQPR